MILMLFDEIGNEIFPLSFAIFLSFFRSLFPFRRARNLHNEMKVVRMFIAVVTIFAICWLPYHMFYVYAYHKPHITSKSYVPHLFLGFYWLAMSNSMVNPIIYYWMNRRFRHYFQKIMCFCCFHLWRKNEMYKSETVYLPNSRSLSIERRSKSCKYTHIVFMVRDVTTN